MNVICWANDQQWLKRGLMGKTHLSTFPACRSDGLWYGLDAWVYIIHVAMRTILVFLVPLAESTFMNALGNPRSSAELSWQSQVVTAPAGAFLAALPSLGVNSHLDAMTDNERRAELSRLADMGATWVRGSAPWYALQPEAGRFDPVQLDRMRHMVMDATAMGMRVLVLGDQAPDWAGGGDDTASHPEAYGAFMGGLARQLRDLGPAGSSPAYELMNEPNGLMAKGRAWANPVDYARSACAAY